MAETNVTEELKKLECSFENLRPNSKFRVRDTEYAKLDKTYLLVDLQDQYRDQIPCNAISLGVLRHCYFRYDEVVIPL